MGSLRNIRGQERRDELEAVDAFAKIYSETVTDEEGQVLNTMYQYNCQIFQLKGQGQRFRLADSSYSSTSCTTVRRSVVVSLLDKGLIERTDDKTYYHSRVDYVLSKKGWELMGQLRYFAHVQLREINRRSRANPTYIRDDFTPEPEVEA